ncbi:sugar transferase [uncultured Lacinutrix sp.]|uniref:sugar transferase n=1 Tax=uncultured Lacinutrix sp. TaxID=574032 RepID=UPI00260BE90E|nr:sugar transferase [uncultured Lacinutrix sp.]
MVKRVFDIFISLIGLIFISPLFLVLIIFSAIDTSSNGFFLQIRIGKEGKKFLIYKIRTYHAINHTLSNYGRWLRKSKLDEIPQLINILKGEMSLVGPRPDVEKAYDKLSGEHKKIMCLKPGITSLATLKYYNEEYLLRNVENQKDYIDKVIFPDKVRMNMYYFYNQSIVLDIKILIRTIIVVIFKNKQ